MFDFVLQLNTTKTVGGIHYLKNLLFVRWVGLTF